MTRQIQGAKLLTRVIARDRRSELLEIERQLNSLITVVDRFYALLGPRNWIFHDSLSFSAVESILDQTSNGEEAERRLIDIYRDADYLAFWTHHLSRTDGLRERVHQIERAREHYFADQFDSATLHLIAVMDGFVNDYESESRHGLASRDPESMTAWDSVVGHHLGLTNALEAYHKTIKKRVDDEVFELQRHGIVHGAVTKFDNVVVATKAWNMLFAVVDWANATTKARQPEAPKQSLWSIARQMVKNTKVKKKLDVWKPARLSESDPQFEDHEIHALTVEFLTGWRERNFGVLAQFPSRQFRNRGTALGKMAGQLRQTFDGFVLSDFHVSELDNVAPAIWQSRGLATVNDSKGTFECRWIVEEEDGSPGYGSTSAQWRLVYCDPSIWRPNK